MVDFNDLTTNEAAEIFKVTPATIRGWCEKGNFPNAYKEKTPFGAYWKIPRGDVEKFKPPHRGRPPLENPSAATLARRRQRGRVID